MRVEPLDVGVLRFHRGAGVELPEAHAAAKGRCPPPRGLVQPPGPRRHVLAGQDVFLHPRDLEVLRENATYIAVLVQVEKREPLVVEIPCRLVVHEGVPRVEGQPRERRNGQV